MPLMFIVCFSSSWTFASLLPPMPSWAASILFLCSLLLPLYICSFCLGTEPHVPYFVKLWYIYSFFWVLAWTTFCSLWVITWTPLLFSDAFYRISPITSPWIISQSLLYRSWVSPLSFADFTPLRISNIAALWSLETWRTLSRNYIISDHSIQRAETLNPTTLGVKITLVRLKSQGSEYLQRKEQKMCLFSFPS